MTLIQGVPAPTPKFFKHVRAGGFIMSLLSNSIVANPTGFTPGVVNFARYLALAGAVATAVSQLATGENSVEKNAENGQ